MGRSKNARSKRRGWFSSLSKHDEEEVAEQLAQVDINKQPSSSSSSSSSSTGSSRNQPEHKSVGASSAPAPSSSTTKPSKSPRRSEHTRHESTSQHNNDQSPPSASSAQKSPEKTPTSPISSPASASAAAAGGGVDENPLVAENATEELQQEDSIHASVPKEKRHLCSLEELFELYKGIGIQEGGDADVDAMQGSGLLEFASDLGVDASDIVMLIILWKLGSKTQYQLMRSEFIDGFKKLNLLSITGIKGHLTQFRAELDKPQNFRNFYGFCFDYIREPDQKSMGSDLAVETWSLILVGRFKLLEQWCAFVKQNGKSIQKDTWMQLLEFSLTVSPDLKDFDAENSVWPSLIDDFVEDMRSTKNSSK